MRSIESVCRNTMDMLLSFKHDFKPENEEQACRISEAMDDINDIFEYYQITSQASDGYYCETEGLSGANPVDSGLKDMSFQDALAETCADCIRRAVELTGYPELAEQENEILQAEGFEQPGLGAPEKEQEAFTLS